MYQRQSKATLAAMIVSSLALMGGVTALALAAGHQGGGKPATVPTHPAAGATLPRDKPTPRVVKTNDEWRKILTPEQYNVLREQGTERPYSGSLLNIHEKGTFRCAGCGLDLFKSDTKFESGTGWPSFWQPVAKNRVREITDDSLGMHRVEVECARCGGHLGHVFDDGPKPTGLRYCMNSVSLVFAK